MTIVNSSYVFDGPAQRDGRRYVRETHIDHVGVEHVVTYLAAANADYSAILAARVPGIELSLAIEEFRACIDGDFLTTVHLTKAMLVARFRQVYRESNRENCARLATWLIRRVVAGDVTEAQVQSAFGLTDPQYAALRARLLALRDHWEAVQSAAGE